MQFDVWYKNNICGVVTTYDDGLYKTFDVCSDIVSFDICRVYIDDVCLGVLEPIFDKYRLKKKIKLKELSNITDYKAYIKVKDEEEYIYVQDKNLQKILNKLIKKSYDDYDVYMFKYDDKSEFLFDFCITICKIFNFQNKKFIYIKTDKHGKILV